MTNSFVLVLLLIFSATLAACSGSENTVNIVNTGNTNVVATNAGNQNVAATNENTPTVTARNEYPGDVVDEFLKSCEAAGSERSFCRCVLDKVEGEYTFEEFSVIESKINAGEPPDEFVEFTGKARAECTK